jgi:hypothetical protein
LHLYRILTREFLTKRRADKEELALAEQAVGDAIKLGLEIIKQERQAWGLKGEAAGGEGDTGMTPQALLELMEQVKAG